MPARSEIALAVERNEVHGLCGFGYTSLLTVRPHWVADGTVRIIVQENVKGSPDAQQAWACRAPSISPSPPRTGR